MCIWEAVSVRPVSLFGSWAIQASVLSGVAPCASRNSSPHPVLFGGVRTVVLIAAASVWKDVQLVISLRAYRGKYLYRGGT